MPQNSVLDFILEHVEKRPDQTAALVKRSGTYVPVTWAAIWKDARAIARALVALGIAPRDHVCLMSATRLEWVTADLGIMAAGAVTVPIYPSSIGEECKHIVLDSGARLIFAEDAKQVAKFVEMQEAYAGQVVHVVQMTGKKAGSADWVLEWDEFLARGSQTPEPTIDERSAALSGDDILTIIYTSGTTGLPKGVVLTHANMLYEGRIIKEIDVVRTEDVQLVFLPLAHVFAKVLEIAWFSTGHVMAFAESMDTIKANLGEVRPTLMAGVPRVFEKFHAAVLEKGLSATGMKRKLFAAALELSARNGEAEERGQSLGFFDRIKFAALKTLVFKKIGKSVGEIMGGRMRVMVSGGAPLSKKIAWFFRDAGLLIVEGYGMTETSAATCVNLPTSNQIGTVGPAVPGTEVKIAEDGEILVKGPGVMREYWRNPEATAETIQNGWLHTGDIGEIDRVTKSVRITDRKKDLIITAGGKNVAPQKIENLLKNHKLVAQAVVHGDKRKFLSALITVDPVALESFAKEHGLSGSYEELSQHEAVTKAVEAVVEETNRELPQHESIKRFKVLDKDFSIDGGELTPKLSVKRKVVNSRYGHIFDAFYAEKY